MKKMNAKLRSTDHTNKLNSILAKYKGVVVNVIKCIKVIFIKSSHY